MIEQRKAHILLVDDDVVIRDTQAVSLRAMGYTVAEADDGERAWKWLASNRPDVIITGIKMPGIGGFELAERIRKDPRIAGVPYFIFSHRGDPEDRKRAGEIGAAGFFVYGFITPNEIANQVERVMHPPVRPGT